MSEVTNTNFLNRNSKVVSKSSTWLAQNVNVSLGWMTPETNLMPGTFATCKKNVLHAQLLLNDPEETDPGHRLKQASYHQLCLIHLP